MIKKIVEKEIKKQISELQEELLGIEKLEKIAIKVSERITLFDREEMDGEIIIPINQRIRVTSFIHGKTRFLTFKENKCYRFPFDTEEGKELLRKEFRGWKWKEYYIKDNEGEDIEDIMIYGDNELIQKLTPFLVEAGFILENEDQIVIQRFYHNK